MHLKSALGGALLALSWGITALAGPGHHHSPESGGGIYFESGTALTSSSSGTYQGVGGIGGKGLRITDGVWRVGGEGVAHWGTMTSGSFGGFADYIVASPGPFRLYAGMGAGLGFGKVETSSVNFSGAWVYLKPEVGLQMNMGRSALEFELSYHLMPISMVNESVNYPGHIGVSIGLLRGNFGVNRPRLQTPGPRGPRGPRTAPPPPRGGTRSPTYQPPPPPPPRGNTPYQPPPPPPR